MRNMRRYIMKGEVIVIRLEESKKKELSNLAKENQLTLTKLFDIMMDNILYGTNDSVIQSNRKKEIVQHMMNINDLASQLNGELANELLKELGELECLL